MTKIRFRWMAITVSYAVLMCHLIVPRASAGDKAKIDLAAPAVQGETADLSLPLRARDAMIPARIPAVVNCGDATVRLSTGDKVRVDGVQGEVEILERAPGLD